MNYETNEPDVPRSLQSLLLIVVSTTLSVELTAGVFVSILIQENAGAVLTQHREKYGRLNPISLFPKSYNLLSRAWSDLTSPPLSSNRCTYRADHRKDHFMI